MRARVIYESLFGNTEAIAHAIARGLGARQDVVVDVFEVETAPLDLSGLDLLVVGGPIHVWGMSRASTRNAAREEAQRRGLNIVSRDGGIRDWLDQLATAPDALQAATFDTAVKISRWFPTGSAARPAARRLARLDIPAVAAAEHFFVEGKEGPLVEGELERAEAWGAGLADACLAAGVQGAVMPTTQTMPLS